jgi:hypothetical protein
VRVRIRDVLRVAAMVPRAERWRRVLGIEAAVYRARVIGADQGEGDREKLWRAILLVDRGWPTGPNCYRRVLLAMALDARFAREKFVVGLDIGQGPADGHAWVGTGRGREQPYDVEIPL